jgi:hypothetical protein
MGAGVGDGKIFRRGEVVINYVNKKDSESDGFELDHV